MSYAALAVVVGATSSAQVLFRMYFLWRRPTLILGAIVLFCMAPVANYVALKGLQMSTVYMATGLTYVVAMTLSKILLDELVTRRMVYAVGLIVGGTVLFNLP